MNPGDFYGAGHNEMLIGQAIKGRRDAAFISVKFGAVFHNGYWLAMDLRPIAIRNFVNNSVTLFFSTGHSRLLHHDSLQQQLTTASAAGR